MQDCMRYLLDTVDAGQFGEAGRGTSMEANPCTAVDNISNTRYFSHLKKGPPKKINQFKCKLYLENFHCFT